MSIRTAHQNNKDNAQIANQISAPNVSLIGLPPPKDCNTPPTYQAVHILARISETNPVEEPASKATTVTV